MPNCDIIWFHLLTDRAGGTADMSVDDELTRLACLLERSVCSPAITCADMILRMIKQDNKHRFLIKSGHWTLIIYNSRISRWKVSDNYDHHALSTSNWYKQCTQNTFYMQICDIRLIPVVSSVEYGYECAEARNENKLYWVKDLKSNENRIEKASKHDRIRKIVW